jgi:hypothetical protein
MRNLVRQIVEGYKSVKLIAQDEGYVVFSGKEPDTKQTVDIKVLPKVLAQDPRLARQFQGLARTIRQLNHPNIASIRKVGDEEGLPYIITRTLEKGHPLAARLNQPWAIDTAADVAMQVGEALEHAHHKGIVHGSLTPENVVIEDNGRVQVTDLGLNELKNLVGMQAQEGASPYLAPERVADDDAGASADVYSLAAILYSMLTKRQPQVVNGEVLPPSRFNPDVPPAMDQVVVRALSPDPANRYPDARTFLTALGAVTLVPGAKVRQPDSQEGLCPRCGAQNQSGKFCRKCGLQFTQPVQRGQPPLAESKLDEPIQVTQVDVGRVEVDESKGVTVHETLIARPMKVAGGEIAAQFPEPPEIPKLNMEDLWPAARDKLMITMPELPPMPVVDWAEIAPPMPEVPAIDDIPVSGEKD